MKTLQKSTETIEGTPELFTLLGLAALNEDQKALIRTELEQIAYKRIMAQILKTSTEEHRTAALNAMKRGDSATALEQVLLGVNDMQLVVVDEVRRLRQELYGAVQHAIST